MKVGEKATLDITSDFGYGARYVLKLLTAGAKL